MRLDDDDDDDDVDVDDDDDDDEDDDDDVDDAGNEKQTMSGNKVGIMISRRKERLFQKDRCGQRYDDDGRTTSGRYTIYI